MAYPHYVEIAWEVVNKVLEDWQATPFAWYNERDLQVEIASRLRRVYDSIGAEAFIANYENSPVTPQVWSRVTCEPHINYTFEDGEKYRCHPDVVVWDDIPDPDSPPDANGEEYPILWACEIKYLVDRPGSWDIEKLRYLVEQGIMKHGCWLRIRRKRAKSGTGITWSRDKVDGRLWTCDASLPASDAS